MHSTRMVDSCPYIGGDLTDRYSRACRCIDVCGLTLKGSRLTALFWHWQWDPAPQSLDVKPIIPEIRRTHAVMLDGPQGLARPGESLRLCERLTRTVGRTPDIRPPRGRPYAGFLWSSLDLFTSLAREGTQISPPGFVGGVSEVYPGYIWKVLSDRIPSKKTKEGRLARKRILEALGVSSLPELPTHDQNDACVAALLAAATDSAIPGVAVKGVGAPLIVDPEGILREGLMVIPLVDAPVRDLINRALE